MKKADFWLPTLALMAAFICSSVAAAKDPGVSFKMTSKGPRALERAVLPYQRCVTAWMNLNRGAYEGLPAKMDFRRGPAECAEQRRSSEEAGMAALGSKIDETKRRKAVRQELLSIDISIFSGLVWSSQTLPENQ